MSPTTTHHNPFGLFLFVIYLLLYGGFVLINAFAPELMEATPIAGVNLAILYGFGLILAAFAMALLYGFFGAPPRDDASQKGGKQ